MSTIHKKDPTRKASGVIFLKKYKVIDAIAKTLTRISISRISFLEIKWYLNAWITCFLSYAKYIVILIDNNFCNLPFTCFLFHFKLNQRSGKISFFKI